MGKKQISIIVSLVLVLLMLSSVSAITGKIGNARMIIRAETGDVIEKSIRVINDNEVSLEISVSSSGDLAEDIDILDKNFVLLPGEEKKAEFTIKVKDEGTKEGKVDVQFSPVDGENGVGLSSTVIVIAEDKGFLAGLFGEDSDEDSGDEVNQNSDLITGSAVGSGSGRGNGALFFVITLGVFLILLFVLLLIMINKKSKVKKTKLRKRVGKK